MKLLKFHDFMRLPFFFYNTIGIQPYTRSDHVSGLTLARQFYFYLGIINLSLMLIAEITYVFLSFKHNENFVQATMTGSYIGFVAVGEFKMTTVWLKKAKLTKFIREMEEIFPETLPAQKKYKLSYYLKQCKVITTCFSVLYMILIWTYNLMAIIQYSVFRWVVKSPEAEQVLPYLMSIPWNWQENWSYYVLYALQAYAGYTAASGHISSDLLLYSVATQMVMHYDYLSHSLENYEIQAMKNNRVSERSVQDDMNFLQDMIVYHEKLLKLTDQMNAIFGVPLLMNFITSSFVICFVGFQMTIGVGPEVLFKLALFLVSSMTQVYLICYFSQNLIDASFGVSTAVYNQNWYNANVRFQKMLILIAERAQKPMCLQATIFLPISRRTMTEIMQLSYKFFALLRTMYSK